MTDNNISYSAAQALDLV